MYSADIAQNKYEMNLMDKGPTLKISNDYDLVNESEHLLINEKMSPEAAVEIIKEEGKTTNLISSRTVRNYIKNGLIFNISTSHSIYKTKKKKEVRKASIRSRVPKSKNIAFRPAKVDERSSYGHWEVIVLLESVRELTTFCSL